MADLKLPIALVFAMAVQLVALVWYISNIVHDIEHLQGQISTQQDIIDLLNDDIIKNEIFSKLKMIGFLNVEINANGYVSGSLNVILEN